ncbi:hypothetical protein AOLI_G00050810 [Acnodon oligacanthus]
MARIVITLSEEQREQAGKTYSPAAAAASAPHLRRQSQVGAVNHIITTELRASLEHTADRHGNTPSYF